MSTFDWLALAGLVAVTLLLLLLIFRQPRGLEASLAEISVHARESKEAVLTLVSSLKATDARLSVLVEQAQRLGEDVVGQHAAFRKEMAAMLANGHQATANALAEMRSATLAQLSVITSGAATNAETLNTTALQTVTTVSDRLADLKHALDAALKSELGAIRTENATKLEEMRRTVDEKLHATLEQRLGDSFKIVSDRLEQVHRGLGEMQSLATGVGDLRRVLTNVKTRGTFGEVQLGALLDQLLTPEQYVKNAAPSPGSTARVEYAIRMPGRSDDGDVLLPVDAKFPVEDYQRILDAQDRGDSTAVEAASAALEGRIRAEGRSIRDKYITPPHTTDFAILYLATEGLYAEALRRPGLVEWLQRECRVIPAGPTTLAALLNSLQMGFRTLAIEKRSSEVWQLLGAVKTEFGKFADALAHTKKKLAEASNSIDSAEQRNRVLTRRLRSVEGLPAPVAAAVLNVDADPQGADVSAESESDSGPGS